MMSNWEKEKNKALWDDLGEGPRRSLYGGPWLALLNKISTKEYK